MARKGGMAHPGADVANAVAEFLARSLAIADQLVLLLRDGWRPGSAAARRERGGPVMTGIAPPAARDSPIHDP